MQLNHRLYDKKTGQTRPVTLKRLIADAETLETPAVKKPSDKIRMTDLPSDSKGGKR